MAAGEETCACVVKRMLCSFSCLCPNGTVFQIISACTVSFSSSMKYFVVIFIFYFANQFSIFTPLKMYTMCNFMGVNVSKIQFIKLKQIQKELGTLSAMKELEKMKDGFKYSNSAIVKATGDRKDIDIISAHWEFIPDWVTSMRQLEEARKQGIPWLNARSETLLSSRMFRDAAIKRRCLVLVSHFFEWRHYKPEGSKKEIAYPYLIEVNDADYFYMAGIYNSYKNEDTGVVLNSFAIVTTQANELMAEVHNKKKRMPTILPEDLAWEWIMEDLSEERIKEISSYQFPSENMYAYTIQKDFKSQEDPLAAFEYEELPALDIAL
jgi:putative SOS response-associated peptidase YedK